MQAEARQETAIIWFRQDLRLSDHAALHEAAAGGRRVVPVYVLDDDSAGTWRMGGASRWWLHHSLVALGESLAALGTQLVLRRGRARTVLPALVAETGATCVHAGRMHEPWARVEDAAVEAALPGGMMHWHRTATLFDPDSIRTKAGGIYGVYTPFARALRERGPMAPPLPCPDRLRAGPEVGGEVLADWGLLPARPDWAGGLREAWTPGEKGAQRRLVAAQAVLDGYADGRNRPDQDGTSRLSPHLHFGEVSPGQVWAAACAAGGAGLETFLGEILWREFSAYLLWHNPHLPEHELRPRFAALWAGDDPAGRQAWERGQTGIPIVDAGMRQLWQTGWMHNRVRMIVASFLTKHQRIAWQKGEAWFWDTLVDADLASNAASWQWVAGSGIDAQPFFRIFNPVSQGEKFDPEGTYVRRFVPELARLPAAYIHAPWTAPEAVRHQAGVTLGRTYPAPVVDLAEGRRQALAAFRALEADP